MKFICPLSRIPVNAGSCPALGCMHNFKGDCREPEGQRLASDTDTEEARVSTASRFYGISVDDVRDSLRKIRVGVFLNLYVTHVLGKSLEDVTTKDLITIRESKAKFNTWASSTSQAKFWEGAVAPDWKETLETFETIVSSL